MTDKSLNPFCSWFCNEFSLWISITQELNFKPIKKSFTKEHQQNVPTEIHKQLHICQLMHISVLPDRTNSYKFTTRKKHFQRRFIGLSKPCFLGFDIPTSFFHFYWKCFLLFLHNIRQLIRNQMLPISFPRLQ